MNGWMHQNSTHTHTHEQTHTHTHTLSNRYQCTPIRTHPSRPSRTQLSLRISGIEKVIVSVNAAKAINYQRHWSQKKSPDIKNMLYRMTFRIKYNYDCNCV